MAIRPDANFYLGCEMEISKKEVAVFLIFWTIAFLVYCFVLNRFVFAPKPRTRVDKNSNLELFVQPVEPTKAITKAEEFDQWVAVYRVSQPMARAMTLDRGVRLADARHAEVISRLKSSSGSEFYYSADKFQDLPDCVRRILEKTNFEINQQQIQSKPQ